MVASHNNDPLSPKARIWRSANLTVWLGLGAFCQVVLGYAVIYLESTICSPGVIPWCFFLFVAGLLFFLAEFTTIPAFAFISFVLIVADCAAAHRIRAFQIAIIIMDVIALAVVIYMARNAWRL